MKSACALAAMLVLTALSGCASEAAPVLSFDPLTNDPAAIDIENPPMVKEITVPSKDGSRMAGRFLLADGAGPHPTILLLHGYPGTETNLDIAQMLRRAGYNVLFIHYRGAWGSEGKYSIAHIVEDATAALVYLRSGAEPRVDAEHLSAIGHSMGGMAALLAAEADSGLGCVAGWAPADGNLIAAGLDAPQAAADFAAYTDSLVMLGGASGAGVVADLREHRRDYDVAGRAAGLAGKAVLLVGAQGDDVLPVDVFHATLDAAFEADPRIKLTSIVIEGDHAFSWTRLKLARTTLDWLDANCR